MVWGVFGGISGKGGRFGDWVTAWSLPVPCTLVVVFFVLAPLFQNEDVSGMGAKQKYSP